MANIKLSQIAQGGAYSPLTDKLVGVRNGAQDVLVSTGSTIIPNLSSLRQLAGGSQFPIIYIEGYYSVNDGGQGNFVYVPSDTTSADNGGTIIVDADGHRYYRETNGFGLNIKYFGAIGDGTSHPLSRFYNTLPAAQAVYSFATSLTNEIDWAATQQTVNLASTNGPFAVFCPAGTYLINQTVVLPQNIYLMGVGMGTYHYGTVFMRSADIIGWQCIGISITVQPTPFGLAERVQVENILFDGGDDFGNGYNGTGTHFMQPLWQLKAVYEFYFTNCRWQQCAGTAMQAWEFWDSRFINCVCTFSGSQDGTLPAFDWDSGSASPGYETCNNLYSYGWRFESNPGVCISIDGNNGVDFWFTDCKFECVQYQLDYLIRTTSATGLHLDSCWMYVDGTAYKNLSWTDASTTGSVGIGNYTFNIATGLVYNSPTLGGSQVFSNMWLVAISSVNPSDYMVGRITSYNSTTGVVGITTNYYSGNTADTISSWIISPIHPGLLWLGGDTRLCKGSIIGGASSASNGSYPASLPYLLTFIRIDSPSENIDFRLEITQGTDRLPGSTFLAYQDSTTTDSVGAGVHNFTIQTGLTIAANTMFYIFGKPLIYHSDWMIGRVLSYNSMTGAISFNVDPTSFGGVPGDSVTGWIITDVSSSMVLQTGQNLLSGANNRVSITGGSQAFGFAMGTNTNSAPNEMESVRMTKYGSPTLYQRNKTTQEDWYVGNIVNDPTTISGTVYNTGQYQFAVYDFARTAQYTVWFVDGARNFSVSQPFIMRNRLYWIDADTTHGFRQGAIVGAGSAAPTTGTYLLGDQFLNSDPTAGGFGGWICVTGGTPGTWKTCNPISS